MKKRGQLPLLLLILAFIVSILLTCCGKTHEVREAPAEAESKMPETEEIRDTEAAGAVENTEDDSSNEYLNLVWDQDGLFFACSSDSKSGTKYILDANGIVIANFEEEADYCKLTEDSYAVGNYFMLENQTVYTLMGEKVFSLEDSEYDGIASTEPLDVGYLILTKKVNTFDETSTHYYGYNLMDNSSYELTGVESYPGSDYWFYFGNGHYVYAQPNQGFGNTHLIYHVQSGEMFSASYTKADGEVTSTLPDIYFWNQNFYDNEYFYGLDDGYEFVYSLETGEAAQRTIVEGAESVTLDREFDKYGNVVGITYRMPEDDQMHYALLDYATGVVTPMDDYKAYTLYGQSDSGYLCQVTNDGGGSFMTVVETDGSRRFEPVPENEIRYIGDSYFAILYENDGFIQIWNWDGTKVGEIEEDDNVCYGKNTIVHTDRVFSAEKHDNDYFTYLFDVTTGKDTAVYPANRDGMDWIFETVNVQRVGDGYYVGKSSDILKDDGTILFMRVNSEGITQ